MGCVAVRVADDRCFLVPPGVSCAKGSATWYGRLCCVTCTAQQLQLSVCHFRIILFLCLPGLHNVYAMMNSRTIYIIMCMEKSHRVGTYTCVYSAVTSSHYCNTLYSLFLLLLPAQISTVTTRVVHRDQYDRVYMYVKSPAQSRINSPSTFYVVK